MKKQKLIYDALRFILGSLLIVAVIASFLKSPAQMGMSPTAVKVMQCFWDTGYIMWAVKAIEIIFAVSLLFNSFVKFTVILFAPVITNIILFDVFADNLKGLPVALAITAMTSFIVYVHRSTYELLFNSHMI
jgi:putative oxidoreductase